MNYAQLWRGFERACNRQGLRMGVGKTGRTIHAMRDEERPACHVRVRGLREATEAERALVSADGSSFCRCCEEVVHDRRKMPSSSKEQRERNFARALDRPRLTVAVGLHGIKASKRRVAELGATAASFAERLHDRTERECAEIIAVSLLVRARRTPAVGGHFAYHAGYIVGVYNLDSVEIQQKAIDAA